MVMKKYLEPELTVVRFGVYDVLNSSKPSTTEKELVTDEEGVTWTPWH